MPMGYDIGNVNITVTTTSAMVASLLTTSTAAKPGCAITSVWADVAGNAMTTAGGFYLLGNTWQTVGVQTTPTAASKKSTYAPAASTQCVIVLANGSVGTGTQSVRISLGYGGTGPGGFWIASSPDMALNLAVGGSTAGYADFTSRGATASSLLNWTVEFTEY